MKKLLAYLKERRTLSALLVILVSVLFYMLLDHFGDVRKAVVWLFGVLSPLLLAALIAYLLDPFARWLEKALFCRMKQHRAARVLSVVLAFVAVLALFILLIATLVPQLINSAGLLLSNLKTYFADAEAAISQFAQRYPQLDISLDGILNTLSTWLDKLTQSAANNMDTILTTSYKAGSKVLNFVLSVVMSLYILLDKENILYAIRRWAHSRMKPEKYERVHSLIHQADRIFIGFLGGNVLDSIIIGVLNFIAMKILGMPYALLISAVVGVTNFIPTFGPIIGAVPSLFLLLLIRPLSALEFLILTIVLQSLDPYVIKPLLFGDVTGLRPLWVMVGVVIGGRLFGIWGMVFGIPLLAVLTSLLREHVDSRLRAQGLDDNGNPLPAAETAAETAAASGH